MVANYCPNYEHHCSISQLCVAGKMKKKRHGPVLTSEKKSKPHMHIHSGFSISLLLFHDHWSFKRH